MLAVIGIPVETLNAAAAAGLDVALKVTLLLSVVLALSQTLLRRSPFAQAAVYTYRVVKLRFFELTGDGRIGKR